MAKDKKDTAEKAETSSDKQIKVKFIKCPTGAFQLAYNEGDEAELPVELAKQLVEAKFATSVIE